MIIIKSELQEKFETAQKENSDQGVVENIIKIPRPNTLFSLHDGVLPSKIFVSE